MKDYVLCLIYDKVADLYSAPMLFDNESVAVRYFSNILEKTPNKGDYELYIVANFNDKTGIISMIEKKLLVKGGSLDE